MILILEHAVITDDENCYHLLSAFHMPDSVLASVFRNAASLSSPGYDHPHLKMRKVGLGKSEIRPWFSTW